jgi:hypothetical protein
MKELDIPIFAKAYDLVKKLYELRSSVPRQDRYALWQRCENLLLEILEGILLAGSLRKGQKLEPLEKVSIKLNVLRIFLRLAKDVKVIDLKKYAQIEEIVDEVGRMLGGWIKSEKELAKAPPV